MSPICGAACVAGLCAALVASPRASAQSLVEHPPNLQGVWALERWSPLFVFSHRFEIVSGGDELVNIPTLTLGMGLPGPLAAGLNFTSNTEVGPALGGNETELWLRVVGLRRAPFALGAVGAWNTAAASLDAAVTGALGLGRLELMAEARVFSDGYGRGEPIGAAGAGAMLRLTRRLAVTADVVRPGGGVGDAAWSAGVAAAIPGSPHTLSLYATNAGATTLQGSARKKVIGTESVRYGFAFTVPLGSGRQWARIFSRAPEPAPAQGDTVLIAMRDVAFTPGEVRIRPGQVVVWVNEDPLAHTTTADAGWSSGLLEEGERFARRFDTAGRYPYHCLPHPQMRGVIVVADE